jgi:uncharacterized membrane protein
MKTSAASNYRSIAVKIVMGLVLAAALGASDVTPASAGEGHGHGGGHYDNRRIEHRGYGHDRGYRRGYYRGRPGYRPYGYVEPVYVAPPVYYAPPPEPGVSIFLPSIHIR